MPLSDHQPTLDGLPAPYPTDRLFFAVSPDAVTAARIAALARSLHDRHGLAGRPLRADRLHATLHHLGDYAGLPSDVIAKAERAAGRVVMPAFDVRFDSVASFDARARKWPLVLRGTAGVTPLIALQRALGEAMMASGLSQWVGRNFTPHVTLLYDDKAIAAQAIEPIGWDVRELRLIHSLLRRTEHRLLGRWSLRHPADPERSASA